MSSLILPRRFYSQPTYPAEISERFPRPTVVLNYATGIVDNIRRLGPSTLPTGGNLSDVTPGGVGANVTAGFLGYPGNVFAGNTSIAWLYVFFAKTRTNANAQHGLRQSNSATLSQSLSSEDHRCNIWESSGRRDTIYQNIIRNSVNVIAGRITPAELAIFSGKNVKTVNGAWTGGPISSTANPLCVGSSELGTEFGTDMSSELVVLWSGQIPSEADMLLLQRDPWILFKAKPRILYFTTAGSSPVTIATDVAQGVATGLTAGVSNGNNIGAIVGVATASDLAAAIYQHVSIAASIAQASATGAPANVANNITIICSAAQGSATGFDAEVNTSGSSTISCSVGSAGAAGLTAAIDASTQIAALLGVGEAAGLSATITNAAVGTGTLDEATILAIADAVWNTELEIGYTAREMMRIMFASLAGKREGIGTATEYYYDVATGLIPRVVFTPDSNGNGVPIVDGS